MKAIWESLTLNVKQEDKESLHRWRDFEQKKIEFQQIALNSFVNYIM